MMAYHPTQLTMLTDNCPAALDMREQRIPYDRSLFAAGIAAHAVMEIAGNEVRKLKRQLTTEEIDTIAEQVSKKLIGEGRSYDGEPEPPLNPGRVFEGRDMAVKYLYDKNLSETGLCEVGFAYDKDWNPVEYYAKNARFRTILDVIDVVETGNEEWIGKLLVVTDYKTSWRADKSELDTLQRRAQAVTAWKSSMCKDVDGIRLRIVNLRSGAEYTRDVWLTEDGQKTLSSWQADLSATMDAADWKDPKGKRPASPGVRCINCSYVSKCSDAKDLIWNTDIPEVAPEAIVRVYAASLALTKELEKAARVAVDRGTIDVDDGKVGYLQKTRRIVGDEVPDKIWSHWKNSGGDAVGLLKAVKLGARNIENASKLLFGRRQAADRKEWVADLLEEQSYASFGVEREK